jgi:hypothetical protein
MDQKACPSGTSAPHQQSRTGSASKGGSAGGQQQQGAAHPNPTTALIARTRFALSCLTKTRRNPALRYDLAIAHSLVEANVPAARSLIIEWLRNIGRQSSQTSGSGSLLTELQIVRSRRHCARLCASDRSRPYAFSRLRLQRWNIGWLSSEFASVA